MTPIIKLKRIYESTEAEDGYQILIDRLWPRGIGKEAAQIDLWLKEIAPSTSLRKWFKHDPQKWQEFQLRYKNELIANSQMFDKLKSLANKHQTITLLFASANKNFNHALVLKIS